MKYILYGDGVHDDTLAIQELIDSGVCEVALPAPKKFYLISAPLVLPSNFRLVLPRFAEVRLAEGASCLMVQNKMTPAPARRLEADCYENPVFEHLWSYVDDYAPDAPCQNIELRGGIWNYNNQQQLPNPEQRPESLAKRDFYGCAMLFYNVRNLRICELTVKDPCQYGITLDTVSYFTVENITFDYNLGNPIPLNMDGVHLDGNCRYGTLQNLKGNCYDDLVALNAHEGSRGDISDIEIQGLFADHCHSAVRLLAAGERVERVHITDVYGNFYQYCVGLTKFYKGKDGFFDAITVENIFAAKAMPVEKDGICYPRSLEDALPFLWVQKGLEVETLTLREIHRREKCNPKATVIIDEGALVHRLVLENITSHHAPLLENSGRVEELCTRNLSEK